MDFNFLKLATILGTNSEPMWTLVLLLTRFTTFFLIVPGIGSGFGGLAIRGPIIAILALVSMVRGAPGHLPNDYVMLIAQLVSEASLGAIVGFVPLIFVSAIQTAGQISSTTMGLQASQLIDPLLNTALPDISRIYGDLVIMAFLLLGGHHACIYALSGLSGEIVPGTFIVGASTINALMDHTAMIFEVGVMVSAPVIMALLLTNFVMGLMSKAIPSVNIFVISFPLTIGIGLILSILALPEVVQYMNGRLGNLEPLLLDILRPKEI